MPTRRSERIMELEKVKRERAEQIRIRSKTKEELDILTKSRSQQRLNKRAKALVKLSLPDIKSANIKSIKMNKNKKKELPPSERKRSEIKSILWEKGLQLQISVDQKATQDQEGYGMGR